jgi:hypothetical protein
MTTITTTAEFINADGSRNEALIERVIAGNVAASINLAVCGICNVTTPRGLCLGEASAWFAAKASALGGSSLVSDAYRTKIAADERRMIEEHVATLAAGWRARHVEFVEAAQ